MVNKLAGVLRNARLGKGLSPRDVQKLSDNTITSAYIYLIETKDAVPAPKKLRVLAHVYKLDFLELMVIAGHVNTNDLKT